MNTPAHDLFAGDDGETRRFGFRSAPRQKFAPWHKARKQFIRSEHWGAEIQNLLMDTGSSSPIKYFGLPGNDMLDLRYFVSEYFPARTPKLRFLAFDRLGRQGNSWDSASATGSLAALRRMDGVDNRSEVFDEELALIGEPDSLASERFNAAGPFDIVNIDLTDGVAKSSNESAPSMYAAIAHIFDLQRRQKRPWLFFLTTRYDSMNVHRDARNHFGSIILKNLDQCASFAHAYDRCFPDQRPAFGTPWSTDATAVGICKWLVDLAVNIGCEVAIRWVAKYRVQDSAGEPDMLSLVIRVTPDLRPAGVRAIGVLPLKVDECLQAKQIPGAVKDSLDVDKLMQVDEPARDRALADTADLLVATGRYSADEYFRWIADGAPSRQVEAPQQRQPVSELAPRGAPG
ncbi:PP_RS20740 family protein [Micromonospora aurantiaca (nom. illeg.)]|uniref:PP_RS20740 family protein n=1 Tax=Micromonospora aurantiaca (nom. illeg.) TaxID=47850 RepID=UPI003404000E